MQPSCHEAEALLPEYRPIEIICWQTLYASGEYFKVDFHENNGKD